MLFRSAIKAQNAQVAAGQLGGTPPVKGQQLNASIIAQTRLTSADEFSKILLKVNQDGSQVRLRDVAKVELGGENYDIIAKFNGKPASGLGIKLATGANALDTATAIRAELKKMEPYFPSGLKIVYPYDTTPFVKISIHEVVKTLAEAIILVFLVMYLFLQNFRDADPNHRRSGRSAGDLCYPRGLWFLDKHPDDVRDGACHRPAGG